MRIRNYRNQFIETLTPIYDATEAESFFYLILENRLQMKRSDLALHPEIELSASQLQDYNDILKKLEQQIPIQYILGTTSFYGLEFEVNDNVLIPRPETEELVSWILSNHDASSHLKILDIGTGSGCIAIALAKNLPNAQVFAIDVSEKALATARNNAKSNAVNVSFIEKDILNTHILEQPFDVIVSNPPYVRNLEKVAIKQNVLEHEPHLALFVEDQDALIFYRKIADLAKNHLNLGGQLYFEINQYLGKEMTDLLQEKGFSAVELRKDIYENDRMIFAKI